MSTWTWSGATGRAYLFTVCDMYAAWNDVPGVYLFVRRPGLFDPLPFPVVSYVGQCSSFADRMCGHERWEEALRIGANEVHALVLNYQADRNVVELDLIRVLQPSLNRQHVGLRANDFYGFSG